MSSTPPHPVPEGYMRNPRGALIPIETIPEIDRLRDDLVRQIAAKSQIMSATLARFRGELFGDIQAFIDLSAEKYGTKVGGDKGNVSLLSYDGRFRVLRACQDDIVFDERLQVAKQLIDECLREWTKDSRAELRAIIDNAFQVDKAGNISTGRVLGLRRLKIEDEKWQRAMTAISDAISVVGSKTYVRIYERVAQTDRYNQIALDIAGV